MIAPTYSPLQLEAYVRQAWETKKVRKQIEKKVGFKRPLGFVEGPPTMNGEPHIGHVRGRILKDLWYRYSTLKGENVVFRAGWDTQGLPVELQAEKELGLSGSKSENLKLVGEQALIDKCKELIWKYNDKWREADRLLGMFMDYEKAYWTFKDGYIEREWKVLEAAWKAGILGEGYRVVACCPSCQTALSHAEVGQGYETVEDPSLFYKVKIPDRDLFLIVWTTMPFTVVTDELVGVKPASEYSILQVGSERWVMASERVSELLSALGVSQYTVVEKVLGSNLEGLKYDHPLLGLIPGQQALDGKPGVHRVVAEEFVDATTGSGIVHMSPANGQEDFDVATKRKVPVFNPIDDQLKFTAEAGVFAGVFVRDADTPVVEELRKSGSLLKADKILHEYPTCWRSHHKVVWHARRAYFYWLDTLGALPLRAAKKVQYFYEPPRNRFLELIKEKVPWCISRERVWGTPLPIWICTQCKNKIPVFSRKQILRSAIEVPDGVGFELHRPWIDRVILKCPRCGGRAVREPFVLDTWHNSGAAPFAGFSDAEHKELVPVEFLTEGVDQTRGWAYTLLMENVILKRRAESPYKAFLFQGLVLDEKGNKMSKSLGNIVEGLEVLRARSVDVLRFYLVWKTSPIDSLSFSFEELETRPYQVLNTLYHLHLYFRQNASYDGFDPRVHTLAWASNKKMLGATERWLLSKLQSLIRLVTAGYEECRYHEAARAIEEFVIETLSQTYVPLTRNEIWEDRPETADRRLAIYACLDRCLAVADILLHPITPYVTDFLFQMRSSSNLISVVLSGWPHVQRKWVNKDAELALDLVSKAISVSNSARMKAGLKRRWPLGRAFVVTRRADCRVLASHSNLLRDWMNLKKVVVASSLDGTPIRILVKLNYDRLGPKLKGRIRLLVERLKNIDGTRLHRVLQQGKKFRLDLDGEAVELGNEDLIFSFEGEEGYVVSEKDGLLVALDTRRDRRLLGEGLTRDLARRLQALRKERGFAPTDVLESAFVVGLDGESQKLVAEHLKLLAFLVRVKVVHLRDAKFEGPQWVESELDGQTIQISIM